MASVIAASPRLLIVDDNTENRDMLRRRLQRLGYAALEEAVDGLDALERLRALAAAGETVDVILLDVMMPRMNGIALLEHLAADPVLSHSAVLMISADTEVDTVVRCIELGAEDYLPKPFNPTILRARLGSILEKRRLRAEIERQYRRIEKELSEAREQQLSMLPDTFPDGGPEHAVSIHAVMQPAREVGGDFYDSFAVGPGAVCVAVGDVSDKGVPAALFMARTRSLLRAGVLQYFEAAGTVPAPAHLARLMNDELCRNNPACMFVTLIFGFLDLGTGRMTCVNAGHLRPWIIDRVGQPREISLPPDPPMGIMPQTDYRDHALDIGLGETFVAVTDGLTEMADPGGALYTAGRVGEDLADIAHWKPVQMVAELARRVQDFAGGAPVADDVTALVLRRLR